MRLWRKASAVFKDQNSIWQANLSRHNPDIEKAVIRSTRHYDLSFDRRNVDRVCEWIRLSPYNLAPVLRAVSARMAKTRDWGVALKGLYLMHNVINSRLPCVGEIGRLPFDLSGFKDGSARQAKSWPFNAFVRAYYAFLDKKSTFLFQQADEQGKGWSIMRELVMLQKQQALIDLLTQIKPQSRAAFVPLILDVMDGIILEIFDLYSRICRGIAVALVNIYSGGKTEAQMALDVVRKATQQGDDLAYYFEFCQELGCFYASDFPVVDRIPEEGIEELERIIRSFPDVSSEDEQSRQEEEKDILLAEHGNNTNHNNGGKYLNRDELRTVITDKWEKFEDESMHKNPFGSPFTSPEHGTKNQELPDLISFL